ncbi:MAG: hypothetical protein FVQ81_11235 [Candidatus Glassbacteria bacterium]|nr:hypothetical protein [Candidatus Glassbacteria bacterium]
MNKRVLIAILLVYLCWFALDFVIHEMILGDTYEATARFWRPMAEMKRGLLQVVSIIAATSFVLIYSLWFKEQSAMAGLKYGLLFGLGTGVGMGYGMYSVMPIPYFMAFTWFMGTVVEAGVAGLVTGLVVREPAAAESVASPSPPPVDTSGEG